VGQVGQLGARPLERRERGAIVERRRARSPLDRLEKSVVDDRRLDREAAEVDDPVPDRVRVRFLVGEVLYLPRAAGSVDERELQARRAGIYDEDVQAQSLISGSSSPCSRV
jgi:hypothetical protein